jgi:Ribbon-helix-helix protein, copG family
LECYYHTRMTTMSFSIDEQTKRDFARWAKRAKKSQSELFRQLITESQFNAYFRDVHKRMEPVFAELGLETDDDVYEYLESSETYEQRKQKVARAKAKRP